MTNLTLREQLDLIRELRNTYLNNMEGTDLVEFCYWEDLHNSALCIEKAMEKELDEAHYHWPEVLKMIRLGVHGARDEIKTWGSFFADKVEADGNSEIAERIRRIVSGQDDNKTVRAI